MIWKDWNEGKRDPERRQLITWLLIQGYTPVSLAQVHEQYTAGYNYSLNPKICFQNLQAIVQLSNPPKIDCEIPAVVGRSMKCLVRWLLSAASTSFQAQLFPCRCGWTCSRPFRRMRAVMRLVLKSTTTPWHQQMMQRPPPPPASRGPARSVTRTTLLTASTQRLLNT